MYKRQSQLTRLELALFCGGDSSDAAPQLAAVLASLPRLEHLRLPDCFVARNAGTLDPLSRLTALSSLRLGLDEEFGIDETRVGLQVKRPKVPIKPIATLNLA